ncbi:carbohydrate ABC transporter permease [Roseicyclus mahoneyensis]|uniref:Carbohydrate ABC transporter membrane protein 1 (CUT1 family) n=1 Tax=Roseicyclus mahoneyensis TaxID=164332 RepID=A0A316GP06_9RHOB|nr:sugar ABC transporter permease [Roseicyclus mahoneyensis]PWK62398.1 carbohydrate ABC transporter membrane protein 1 (CUT1 family) [Roseicyclus mahoneyensis]
MTRISANRLTPYMFIAPAALVMLIALFYPIAYMIWGSFRDWDPSQTIGETDFVGLANYARLLRDPAFHESFWVTLVFAFTVVSVEMVLGVGLALLLDRNIRGMSVLRTLFILPMMIAPVVVGLIWRYMFHQTYGTFNRFLEALGLPTVDWLGQNALLSVIIADIWQWTPFIFILSLAALQSLPRSALEAARIDGATGWQQIIYIKLPLMMPVLIVTMLLRLIDAFKVLEVILVLTGGGPGLQTEILALRIARTAREFRELGEAAAMSNYLLMLLMVLTLGMFAFTRWQEARARRLRFTQEEEG